MLNMKKKQLLLMEKSNFNIYIYINLTYFNNIYLKIKDNNTDKNTFV